MVVRPTQILFLFFWCTFTLSIFGQTQSPEKNTSSNEFLHHNQDYIANVQYFSIANGLSHRDTKCVFQDSRGMIWVGTKYGLNRFDGHDFKAYTKEKNGLSSNLISHIFEDAEGWLWLFNEENEPDKISKPKISFLHYITGEIKSFEERFAEDDLLKEADVFSLWGTPDRMIYIGTVDGRVISFHPEQKFKLIHQVKTGNPRMLLDQVPAEKIIIGKKLYAGEQETFFALDQSGEQLWEVEEARHFQYLGEDNQKVRWFYHHIKHTADSIRLYTLQPDFTLARHQNLTFLGLQKWAGIHFLVHRSKDDSFWFLGGERFWVFFPKEGNYFHFNDNFPEICDNGLDGVFFDNGDNVWVTTENGLYKIQLNPNPFQNYLSKIKENLPINAGTSCRGLFVADEELWVTTTTPKQYRIKLATNETQLEDLPKEKTVSGGWDSKVYLNVNRLDATNLFFGGALDVNYSLAGEAAHIIPRHSGHNTHTWFWDKDRYGKWWCGLKDAGLGYWDTAKDSVLFFTHFNEFTALRQSTVYDLLEWDQDHLLIASTSGIYLLHQQQGILQRFWTGSKDQQFLPHDEIYHLYRDQQDPSLLWVATGGGGLLKLRLNTNASAIEEIQQFMIADGLSSNVLYAVYEDEDDCLWLPSDYGIIRFDKSKEKAIAFLEKEGISHHEFNRISHTQDEQGNLYFGGLNGVTSFHPNDLKDHQTIYDAPLVVINLQQFDGQSGQLIDRIAELETLEEVILNPGDQFFRLDFALLNYQDPKQIRYAYRIKGQEKDWTFTKENHLRISGLAYGDYQLQIKGQGYGGEFSTNELTLPIRVLKPFYLQIWFFIFAGLAFSLTTFLLYKWRTDQFKERQEELEVSINKATETIRKQNENLRRDNQVIEQQAEELRKLDETKSRFFANVSHELRTPLTLILGPIEASLNRNQLDNRDATNLLLVKRSGERLKKMVNEILDLNKLEAGKLELQTDKVLWYPYIRNIIANFESLANAKKIEYRFSYEGNESLQVELDKKKIETILSNLLTNAFKFTSEGGRVGVKVKNEGQFLRIEIADTGRGILPEDLPNVFNRFYQSRSKGEVAEGGTGIGLALSKELVQLMNGTIEVESEVSKGSTFSVTIPRVEIFSQLSNEEVLSVQGTDAEILPLLEKMESKELIVGEKPKANILLVEDNLDLRIFIQSLLEPNYQVHTAENGQLALTYLNIGDTLPDLILSDIMMPIMDGYQLLKAIKQQEAYRDIPMIMLTARAAKEDRLKALRIGVDDYLTKPFDQDELMARIANLLKNRLQRTKFHQELAEEITTGKGADENNNTSDDLAIEHSNADLAWLEDLEATVLDKLGEFHFSVEQLASEMALSRWQVNRRIKLLTGMTAREYLLEARLNQARTLLEQGEISSVKALAYTVGIKDLQNFSRHFKQRFGKLPSVYL